MNVKNALIGLSVSGLVTLSLSLSACGSGSSSSTPTVPSPTAALETPPTGFSLVSGSSVNPANSVFTSSTDGVTLTGLALSQGALNPALHVNSPGGILLSQFTSAFFQLFNFVPGASPVLVVTSGPATSTVINTATSATLSGSVVGDSAKDKVTSTTVTWSQYQFGGVNSTSTPIGVATNGGAYIGTDVTQGSFLAFQNSISATNAVPVTATSQTACKVNAAISTAAVSLANASISSGNFIAIGTNGGEVLVYNISGSQAGVCQNLTNASQAKALYTPSSPVGVLSYTATPSANYGYFGTQNGQVWRVIANTSNEPQAFAQINATGGVFNGTIPPSGNGSLTALYSDSNNNVFVGGSTGTIYLLASANSAGGVNTTWTSYTIPGGMPILLIASTTNGKVIAVTVNGIYTVTTGQ